MEKSGETIAKRMTEWSETGKIPCEWVGVKICKWML